MPEETADQVAEKKAKTVSYRDLPEFTIGSKFSPPDMANWGPTMLVDEIGEIRKWKGMLDAADKFLSEALKARTPGALSADGSKFHMSRSESTQIRISPDKCREVLDAETLAKVQVEINVTTMRFDFK